MLDNSYRGYARMAFPHDGYVSKFDSNDEIVIIEIFGWEAF